jgi:site-specific DNA-methyltransferase (adenine-specific)
MTVTLYLGDCLEYMRTMPAGSVDAVITDPPYGMESHNMRNAVGFMSVEWDVLPASPEQIKECLRVSENQIIWGGNYFELPPTRCVLVWDKGEAMYGRSWAECELAWTSFDDVSRICKVTRREEKEHPTQKPLQLMRWCIENYTRPGDTIFDPFMGSGTTGVACVQLGRNFIGCEIDPKYFAIAEKRIHAATLQPQLFQDKKQEERQTELIYDHE